MLTKKEIESYIKQLRAEEIDFKGGVSHTSPSKGSINSKLQAALFIIYSIVDFMALKIALLSAKNRAKKIVYSAYNFTNTVDGVVEDRIVKPLFADNILFINQSKEVSVKRINNQKVYNVGGVSKLLSLFSSEQCKTMQYFDGYQRVNKWILNGFNTKEVYLLWYYDLNSLAIIFSDYRKKLKLIEVQHGSIINYPPYVRPAPVKLIDVFYVKNEATIQYLKDHLCKGFDVEYNLIPYPKANRKIVTGVHILYASTVDFKGLHPIFVNFLKTTKLEDLNIQIRLHPRERTPEIETLFTNQMQSCNQVFTFDKSESWLEQNKVENLIVISPWSSTIEDAVDNGYKAIVIDPAGNKRFEHIIDTINCFYSENLEDEIKAILNSTK